MKLFDALLSLQVGTVQGSPISPLLFILFMNPLIERLKAMGKGISFAYNSEEKIEKFICNLLFADDIVLVAESIEDLQAMLNVCKEWAEEFDMEFNADKCELMQLAGAIPAVRPEVKLGEHVLTWVQVIKYLGIMLREGRRCRLPCPDGKLWQSFHRTKPALDHRLPVSLLSQLHVIKTYVLSIALYPAAVRDLDYAAIDIFVNRLLKKITGTPRTRTGATFLRAELGLPSSKFMAHYRALSYYWHLQNKAWFKIWLPHLRGRGPLERIENMAELANTYLRRRTET